MNYLQHEMEIVEFEIDNSFVRAEMSNGGDGSSPWSILPDRSDI